MHIEVIESTFVNYLQVSNIVFEAVKTILDLFIIIIIIFFFSRKDFERKKAPKCKTNNFHTLKSFCAREKIVAFVV